MEVTNSADKRTERAGMRFFFHSTANAVSSYNSMGKGEYPVQVFFRHTMVNGCPYTAINDQKVTKGVKRIKPFCAA